MKYFTALLLASVTLLPRMQTQAAEWEYPKDGGRTDSSKHIVGKAGAFQSYQTITQDSPEKVVLWYAKQLGLDDDHRLVRRANMGFRVSKNQKGVTKLHTLLVRGKMAEKLGGIYLETVTPESVNVQMFVRPESDAQQDLTISISSTAKETLITVIRSIPKR